MMKSVDAATLKRLMAGDAELAVLDVRETGVFAKKQVFRSISLPLSHFESRVGALVPRKNTPIVLIDAGEGLVDRAAAVLAGWGYTDLGILDGGLDAWEAAGHSLFSGVYVPNKAFGEFVEHRCGTPSIDAATLDAWIRQKKDMIILDSRPYEEFRQFSLPGGISCPGAELVHRAFGMVPSERTTIVVNCAGRTRGIVGAQSLINAGIPNPVVTLRNGTAGWYLNGGSLREGASDVAPPPGPEALGRAIAASERVAARFGVKEIDRTGLQRLLADRDRTLFLLDVRSPEEYAAGHLPGSRSAPGGQLIQSTEHYVGVLRARLVLIDDNRVRARVTASWLLQLGWKEVFVLADGLGAFPFLEHGPERLPVLGETPDAVPAIGACDAASLWRSGEAVFLDFDNSLSYRRGHVPGAWFAVRSRIRPGLPGVAEGGRIVVVSAEAGFSRRAARDLLAAGARQVEVLEGGTAAWRAAGLPLSSGFERMADENDDVWYSPYEFDDLAAAMNAYLSWEVGLLDQLEKEGAPFLPSHDA